MCTQVVLINLIRSGYIYIFGLSMHNIADIISLLISTYPILILASCLLINTFKIYYMGDKKINLFDNFSLKGLTIGSFFGYVTFYFLSFYIIRPYIISCIQLGLENLEHAPKHISDRYAAFTGCISNNITPYIISSIQFGIDSLKIGFNKLSVGFAAYVRCLTNNLYTIAKYYGVKPHISRNRPFNPYVFSKGYYANQKPLGLTKGFDANQKAFRGPNIKLLAGWDTSIKQTSSYVERSNQNSQILYRVSPTPVIVNYGNPSKLYLLCKFSYAEQRAFFSPQLRDKYTSVLSHNRVIKFTHYGNKFQASIQNNLLFVFKQINIPVMRHNVSSDNSLVIFGKNKFPSLVNKTNMNVSKTIMKDVTKQFAQKNNNIKGKNLLYENPGLNSNLSVGIDCSSDSIKQSEIKIETSVLPVKPKFSLADSTLPAIEKIYTGNMANIPVSLFPDTGRGYNASVRNSNHQFLRPDRNYMNDPISLVRAAVPAMVKLSCLHKLVMNTPIIDQNGLRAIDAGFSEQERDYLFTFIVSYDRVRNLNLMAITSAMLVDIQSEENPQNLNPESSGQSRLQEN